MKLADLNLEDAAKQAAGNWKHFHCFIWFRRDELEDPDQWAVVYTNHRDSGLIDQSNAAVTQRLLKPFVESGDVVPESHSHWAVGYLDGFSLRVFKNGEITEAFKTYHHIMQCLDDYPILDEDDYSDREFEATLENIDDAAWKLKGEFDLPEGWESQVYSWLSDNRCREIENVDDQGGYPSEEGLLEAFEALGFQPTKDTATT